MALLETLHKGFSLLWKCEWRELYIRFLFLAGALDFKTVGTEELELSPAASNPYSDTGREYLQRVISSLNIGKGDAIVDFGSGKGGALITLSDYPFSRITGVEISGDLIRVARRNLNRLGIKNVDMVHCDARDFLEMDAYNYFYFFNPFPCNVMREVVANIKRSVRRKDRRITVIYLNPVCHLIMTEGGFLRKRAEYDHHENKFYVYTRG